MVSVVIGGNVAAVCCFLVVSVSGTILENFWGNMERFLEILSQVSAASAENFWGRILSREGGNGCAEELGGL